MIIKFCIGCGAKVFENAKFCYECGSKIPTIDAEREKENVETIIVDIEKSAKSEREVSDVLINSALAQNEEVYRKECLSRLLKCINDYRLIKDRNETRDLSVNQGIEFEVSGNLICFDEDFVEYNKLRIAFYNSSVRYKTEFSIKYSKNVNSLEYLLDVQIPTIFDYINEAASQSVIKLMQYDIDYIDIENIVSFVCNNIDFDEFFKPIMNEVYKVEDFVVSLNINRNISRASRSRWQGGGFGLGGAVKGAVTASALNMGTGIFRGIGDSITNSFDNAKINKMKKAIYENPKTCNYLSEAVFDFTFRIFYYVYKILVNEKKFNLVVLGNNINQFESQVKNYLFTYQKYKTGQEKLIRALCDCINSNPYGLIYYIELYKSYDKTKGIILRIVEYFGLQDEYLESILNFEKDRFERLNQMDENAIDTIQLKIDSYNYLFDDIPIFDITNKIKALDYKRELIILDTINNPHIDVIITNISQEQSRIGYDQFVFDSIEFWKEVNKRLEIDFEIIKIIDDAIARMDFSYVIKEVEKGYMYADYALEKIFVNEVFREAIDEINIAKIDSLLSKYIEDTISSIDYSVFLYERIIYSMYVTKKINSNGVNCSIDKIKQLMNKGNVLASVFICLLILEYNENFKYTRQDAIKILTKTAETFHPRSIYQIGKYYAEGVYGFTKDLLKAEKLLKLSAMYGVEYSVKELKDLQYILNYRSKYCVDCGEENECDATFCEGCGNVFEE